MSNAVLQRHVDADGSSVDTEPAPFRGSGRLV